MAKYTLILLFNALVFCSPILLRAEKQRVIVDTATNLIDATVAPFNQVQPGDTVFFAAGRHDFILIRNFTGMPGKPILFINYQGVVTINTDHYFGISIQNCRYIHLSGTGYPSEFYGFNISRVANGAGIGIGALSTDFEVDHVSATNTMSGGIYAKTDPDCSLNSTRGNFTQFNTIIHDNYISDVGVEGMYIGSTKYFGQNVKCNDKDTTLLPSLLNGVWIYNNIVKYTGWDGIQVSSAPENCYVFGNVVLFDSQLEYPSQMSGIILGGGSSCDCYNNYVSDGKGNGIENHGLGGNRIYNNIIINAGKSYLPHDSSKMHHGIFISDVSMLADSTIHILHNNIINPKSDGIRFSSVVSRNNLIANNLIINPGSFDIYENDNTSFDGDDAYIMIPNLATDVTLRRNFFSRSTAGCGLSETDYSLQQGSILIDSSYSLFPAISFDFYNHSRPYGIAADIGAFEFNPQYLLVPQPLGLNEPKPLLFPNPVKNLLTIKFNADSDSQVMLRIYNVSGKRIKEILYAVEPATEQEISAVIADFAPGIYIYELSSSGRSAGGKFVKE